jgi:hypothetical protein
MGRALVKKFIVNQGIRNFTITLLLALLAGCLQIDIYLAKQDYEKAQLLSDPAAIIEALTRLALLNPAEYQFKLQEAKSALAKVKQAESYILEGNHFLAFIESYDSYRALPMDTSKKILLQSGGEIRYLLDAHSHISSSFEVVPKSIPKIIGNYENVSVTEWDLIELNGVIEKLVQSRKALNRSLKIIERNNSLDVFPALNLWWSALKRQERMIDETQMYIINFALHKSASVLEQLNIQLTDESSNLLSLVRERLAEDAMRPNFVRAIDQYQPYFDLNENLALASSPLRNNTHAPWYRDWHRIEEKVLEPNIAFSQYPDGFNQRAEYLIQVKKKLLSPDLNQGYASMHDFMESHKVVYDLIHKLNRARMILNYGNSTAQ